MASEKEGMFAFVTGALIGAVLAAGAVAYVVNENDRDERLYRVEGKAIVAEMHADASKETVHSLCREVDALRVRLDKHEQEHRCKCGEDCQCEECECPVLKEKECECGDPRCDWPAKATWSRPACPRFAAPPPHCSGHSCPPPRAPSPLPVPVPVPVPGYDADDAYGIPEV